MDNDIDIHQQISEIKKRILLVEGQKTANAEEWKKQNRINCETIATLKKEIKELTQKLERLKNPLQRPVILKEPSGAEGGRKKSALPTIKVGKVNFPIGARNLDDAIYLTDLKIIENQKRLDILRHQFKVKKERLSKLIQQLRDLQAYNEALQSQACGDKPPETLEEDANRKLVCRLENEIHRTNVQWMEAEHIRKKYRSIKASLMNDAERFERSLRELEAALQEQQTEINRLQEVHNEAIEMRDAAKVVLQRQEQQAQLSQKTRERQALEFRKLCDQRKLELERIGRKLFIEGKTLVHQESITSNEQHTGKTETDGDSDEKPKTSQLEDSTTEMEQLFKHLMEVTGATNPQEVLERFQSQKESAKRLEYLRKAAEAEKAQLEAQREKLTQELEALKFTDVKESEVNQEVIEGIKRQIATLKEERDKDLEAADKTETLMKYIKERLKEVVFKLQEADKDGVVLKAKNRTVMEEDIGKYLETEAEDMDFIEIVKIKLQHVQELVQKPEIEELEIPKLDLEDDDILSQLEEPQKSPTIPEGEKPAPIPNCYYNLFTGRMLRTAGAASASPDQPPAAAAATDEETEVPSRSYLKRQSAIIVDAKSRRKTFRPQQQAARKK